LQAGENFFGPGDRRSSIEESESFAGLEHTQAGDDRRRGRAAKNRNRRRGIGGVKNRMRDAIGRAV
jgi:hypothetical protein